MAATKKTTAIVSLTAQKAIRAQMRAARLEMLRAQVAIAKTETGALDAAALVSEIERVRSALKLIAAEFTE